MSAYSSKRTLAIVLIAVGVAGLSLSPYLMRLAWQGPTTMDDAVRIAQDYLQSLGNKDLAIDEIMEFQYNFYVAYYERSTGIGAFEMVIDKPGYGGMMSTWGNQYIRPEQGPNMMWNTKYGIMGGGMVVLTNGVFPSNATISADRARTYAHEYLDRYMPGIKVANVDPFYGYYTLDIEKNGVTYGMLSVNAYTGDVWYHTWHGAWIQTREMRGS
jgi:hypothetical protein